MTTPPNAAMTQPFAGLAAPAVIGEIDYEAVLAALVADVRDRFAAAGVDWDVGGLETDTAAILGQAVAYRETLLRAHINAAARANLRGFARGSDLDHLAEFYGLARLEVVHADDETPGSETPGSATPGSETPGSATPITETDERLNERLTLAIYGRSAAGPKERYEAVARGVDAAIIDAHVYRTGAGPALECAILTSDDNGVPDDDLLGAVHAALNADDIRSINDHVAAVAAVRRTVDIEADIWLAPETPQSLLDTLGPGLRDAWAHHSRIGSDLPLSWIVSRLHGPGVARVAVRAPDTDIIVPGHEAVAIGTVTLNDRGRTR